MYIKFCLNEKLKRKNVSLNLETNLLFVCQELCFLFLDLYTIPEPSIMQ